MNKRKLTNDELRDLFLENCVNKDGDLVICNVDLSDFKGNVILKGWKIGGSVDLSHWEVNGDLKQSYQKVNGDLEQDSHTVKGNLNQSYQTAKNISQSFQSAKNLNQGWQTVGKDLISQKLEEDEVWADFEGSERAVIRTKKLKQISLDELAKMGYKLKEQ